MRHGRIWMTHCSRKITYVMDNQEDKFKRGHVGASVRLFFSYLAIHMLMCFFFHLSCNITFHSLDKTMEMKDIFIIGKRDRYS